MDLRVFLLCLVGVLGLVQGVHQPCPRHCRCTAAPRLQPRHHYHRLLAKYRYCYYFFPYLTIPIETFCSGQPPKAQGISCSDSGQNLVEAAIPLLHYVPHSNEGNFVLLSCHTDAKRNQQGFALCVADGS